MTFKPVAFAASLLAGILLAPLPQAAFAQSKSKAVIQQEINQDFPDNTTGAITPAIVRSFFTDIVNSYFQWSLVNTQTGASYAALTADMGALINVSSQSAFTLTLPAPSLVPIGWSAFIKNSSPSAGVTISPQAGLIGGASTLPLSATQGTYVVSDGTNYQTWGGFGVGTVASVGLALPNIFIVSGSPVTSSGTLTGTLATETANFAFLGPVSGAPASPTFRALVSNDMPTPNTNSLGAVYSFSPVAHNFLTGINNSGTPQAAVPSVSDLATITPNSYLGNPTGSQATPQAGTLGRTADWNQDTGNNTVMVVDQVRLSASPQFANANTGNITLQLNTGMNFNTTLTNVCSPCTVVTPQNFSQPWAGSLIITQASQNSTIAFSKPVWKFAGGTAPTASVTTNDVDIVNFICTAATSCYAFYGGNYQ